MNQTIIIIPLIILACIGGIITATYIDTTLHFTPAPHQPYNPPTRTPELPTLPAQNTPSNIQALS